MIKFNKPIIVPKKTSKELLEELKKSIDKTIEMNKMMREGAWVNKSKVDSLPKPDTDL